MTFRRSDSVLLQSLGVFLFGILIFFAVVCNGYSDPQPPPPPAYQPQYPSPPPQEYQPQYPPPPPQEYQHQYLPPSSQEYQPPYPPPRPQEYQPQYPPPPPPQQVYQPQYPPPPPPGPYQVYEDTPYNAITYLELNTSYHCGVIPETNYELYRRTSDPYEVADIAPYGKYPWIVLILYYDRVICQGTFVHGNLVLTSSKCISEYRSLEYYKVRIGDWDLLTDYNEYESYRDRELRICSRHPISKKYNSKGGGYGNYGGYGSYGGYYESDGYSDFILIKLDYRPNFNQLPQVKPLCLPKTYSNYGGASYSYSDTSYSVCWVAGWYGSKITSLSNHPQPQKVQYKDGYSYGGRHAGSYQEYYEGYDRSMIQKRAKLELVKCPYNKYSYGYSDSSQVCFIGVDGYDACVAEKGAGVFCVVREKRDYGYDAGFNNYNSPDYGGNNYYDGGRGNNDYYIPLDSSSEVQSYLHPDYEPSSRYDNHEPHDQSLYQNSIRAYPSTAKSYRYRAVLYAVVQKPAKCRRGNYDSYSHYRKSTHNYNRKSQPLVATKIDYDAVDGIVDTLWTHGYDESCPLTHISYKSAKSYKYNYYFGTYGYPRQSHKHNRYSSHYY